MFATKPTIVDTLRMGGARFVVPELLATVVVAAAADAVEEEKEEGTSM